MAIMVKQGTEINLKWMFAISLLFHALFLFALLSSNIFNSSVRRYMPVGAIHVNIVDLPRERSSMMPGLKTATGGGAGKVANNAANYKVENKVENKVEKVPKVKKIENATKKEETVALKKVEDVKMPAKKEQALIPEPSAVKEKEKKAEDQVAANSRQTVIINKKATEGEEQAGEGEEQAVVSGEQATVSGGQGVGSGGGQGAVSGGAQWSGFISGTPGVSGPVVNIQNFTYDYYLGVIRNKIDNRWSQPIAYNQTKKTLIEFTIHRSGEIRNIKVLESSGDHYFDQTALRAVSLSNPFPPLPRGYRDNFLNIRYRFIFDGNKG